MNGQSSFSMSRKRVLNKITRLKKIHPPPLLVCEARVHSFISSNLLLIQARSLVRKSLLAAALPNTFTFTKSPWEIRSPIVRWAKVRLVLGLGVQLVLCRVELRFISSSRGTFYWVAVSSEHSVTSHLKEIFLLAFREYEIRRLVIKEIKFPVLNQL